MQPVIVALTLQEPKQEDDVGCNKHGASLLEFLKFHLLDKLFGETVISQLVFKGLVRETDALLILLLERRVDLSEDLLTSLCEFPCLEIY